ncbi:hypothetical protein OG897_13375 [Streptomyces sp. NBC_00237]|uniref:hypothetical protein n=1 Tax=Streptomyces sp. NBC_00237 TaxID=2975687 RepID=UPI00225A4D36|nr:hypothetical protein [Streptomyces sp. NBC_00237]MCX5202434.1 hypothetical protein [Streptomyces sp. NBC_00237]
MPRPWLRHPARTIRTPAACPTSADRYATAHLALTADSITGYSTRTAHQPATCQTCGGWHLERQENR